MKNEKIKQLRDAKGLSQRNLAKNIGVTDQVIKSIEDGKNSTSIANFLALAKYFNVSVDYLLDYHLDSSKEVSNIALSKEELKDLVDSLDDLSSKIKSLLDE